MACAPCRSREDVRLVLVRPEWELRRLWTSAVPVVPDMMVTLNLGGGESRRELSWAIELDSGTERISTVWRAKLEGYGSLVRQRLYGARDWRVLAVVPSERRAARVAQAAAAVGVGGIVFFSVRQALELGRALELVVWTTADACAGRAPSASLALGVGSSVPGQRSRSAADRAPVSSCEAIS